MGRAGQRTTARHSTRLSVGLMRQRCKQHTCRHPDLSGAATVLAAWHGMHPSTVQGSAMGVLSDQAGWIKVDTAAAAAKNTKAAMSSDGNRPGPCHRVWRPP